MELQINDKVKMTIDIDENTDIAEFQALSAMITKVCRVCDRMAVRTHKRKTIEFFPTKKKGNLEEETETMKRLAKTHSIKETANLMGKQYMTIYQRAKKLGIKFKRG